MYTSLNLRALGRSATAAETLTLAAGAGFGGVDLMLLDLEAEGADPREVRARMNDLGLRPGAFPLPVQWRGDGSVFERELARLPRLAATAAELGLTRTGTWAMPETPELPSDADEGARAAHMAETTRMHVDRLGRVARVLDGFGVRLGLEVIGVASLRTGRGLPFVCRVGDVERRLGALLASARNVGLVADSFHLYAAGETVDVALDRGVRDVVWVHVADLPASATGDRSAIIDGDRGLPGEHGAVESAPLLARLARAGYDGPVTAEPMAGCRSLAGLPLPEAVARVARSLRSVWPGLDVPK
jgi:sugar phosphate isomerase/epimerase